MSKFCLFLFFFSFLFIAPSVAQVVDSLPDMENMLNQGWAYLDGASYEKALQTFDQVVREEPRNVEGYFGRAFALEQLGRGAEARIAYLTVLALDEKHYEARFYLGLQYHQAGLYDEAIKTLSTLVDQQPPLTNSIMYEVSSTNGGIEGVHTLAGRNDLILYHRARSYRMANMYDEAVRDIERAYRQAPQRPEYLHEKALIREAEGNKDAAAGIYRDILIAYPAYTEAMYNLTRLTSEGSGDSGAARQAYGKVIESDSNAVEAWASRGILHFDQQQYEKAEYDFKQALLLNDGDEQNWINHGMAQEKLGHFMEAIRDFEKALNLDPQNLTAMLHLGNAYLKQRMHRKALRQYEDLLELTPEHSGAAYNKAIALYNLGQKGSACRALNVAEGHGADVAPNLRKRVCGG
ncbi:tetratricopeptide repeat protein [Roseivirga sp. BDSF3-8]|uniref:tetratricopeptide repeat protein n=1 Tax=Roseivirga sp. BDSF3-8 TaxID=3241598 RepID=UPI0035327C2D